MQVGAPDSAEHNAVVGREPESRRESSRRWTRPGHGADVWYYSVYPVPVRMKKEVPISISELKIKIGE